MTAVTARTLFQITDDLGEIHAALVEAEGVLTPELEARLDAIAEELGGKVDGYGYKLRALEAQAELHKSREAYHATQRRAYEQLADALKTRLLVAMQSLGTKKLVGVDFQARVQESAGAVRVTEESLIPGPFWKQPPPVLDRKALLDTLKKGEAVAGAELERKPFMVIR